MIKVDGDTVPNLVPGRPFSFLVLITDKLNFLYGADSKAKATLSIMNTTSSKTPIIKNSET
jgi:hypothetical protein